MASKSVPVRQCIACREQKLKRELMRVVVSDGVLRADETGKQPGRGAYICRSEECLCRAKKIRAFERALGASPSDGFMEQAREIIEKQ